MTTQEKLEAFVPYLPYEIKCHGMGEWIEGTEYNDKPTPKMFRIVGIVKDSNEEYYAQCEENNGDITDIYVDEYLFPILHPLSDLTKPCLKGGKVPIVELAKECFKACYGFDFKNDKFDVHCNTSSSNYSTIFSDEKDYVFAINNRDWRFNVEFKTRNIVFDLNVNKIIQQLYKWHFWLGDQSEFGKSIVDINTLKTE